MELLAALQKVEERGALETADRALMLCRQVWRYWLPTASNIQRDITEGLKARLTPYRGTNFPAIVEPLRLASCCGPCIPIKVGLQCEPPCFWRRCFTSAPATCG